MQFALPWRQFLPHASALVIIVGMLTLVHGGEIRDHYHAEHWEVREFIQYNRANVHSLVECFTVPPYYPGIYRPLSTTAFYYIGVSLFGDRVEPFRVINLTLVVANAFLLFLVARLLLPLFPALLAAALFASRRAHMDVVLIGAEVQTLLSVFYCLLMLYFFIRGRGENRAAFGYVAAACFALALLSKEPSVMMVGVLAVYAWLFDRRSGLRPYAGFAVITAIWGAFIYLPGRALRSYLPTSLAPSHLAEAYLRHFLDFFNFLLPDAVDVVLAFGAPIDTASTSTIGKIVFGVCAIALTAALALQRRLSPSARVALLGLALFLLTTFPYATLEHRMLMRYSYAGHLGLALAIAAVVAGVRSPRS